MSTEVKLTDIDVGTEVCIQRHNRNTGEPVGSSLAGVVEATRTNVLGLGSIEYLVAGRWYVAADILEVLS